MQNPALPALNDLMQRLAGNRHRGLLLVDSTPVLSDQLLEWPDSCAVFSNQPGYRPLRAYRQALGLSYPCVIVDCRDEINADALAALCGTVVAQGVLVLLLPSVLTPFLQRLADMRPRHASSWISLAQPATDTDYLMPALPTPPPFEQLTAEQHAALHQLLDHVDIAQPALLHAPRGRGKSTVLGHLCAAAAAQKRQVFVSAPSRHQAQTLFTHATAELPHDQHPVFVAPDALLDRTDIGASDILIVDEAASLPRHMLDQIIAQYPQVKMATTTDGYEGCGRGFVLQFCAVLQSQFSAFKTLRLNTPQRWADDCPLEQWVNNAFLLPQDGPTLASSSPQGTFDYQYTHASGLSSAALRECFQLLLDAHYQTTPNDLKMLLDDPLHHLLLQHRGSTLVGVAWLVTEGQLGAKLSDAIYRGTRRPAGNLLAQSLTYYLRDHAAAEAKLMRIVRIAVSPDKQRQGLGSRLLHVCIEQARTSNAVAIGTSFGLAADLAYFWHMNAFAPVRIGSKRDSVSGRYSALFVHPLNTLWQDKVHRWHARLCYHLQPLLLQVALPDSVVTMLRESCNEPPADYPAFAMAILQDFANGYIDFASIQPVLYRTVAGDAEAPELLRQAASSNKTLSEQATDHGFSGRKDYVKRLRQICLTFEGRI